MSDETKETANKVAETAGTVANFTSWAGVVHNFQKFLAYMQTQIPAIAIAIFNYMRGQINQKELENKALKLEIEKGKAHEQINQANANKSDSDIVDDAIRAGGGSTDSKPDDGSGNKPH